MENYYIWKCFFVKRSDDMIFEKTQDWAQTNRPFCDQGGGAYTKDTAFTPYSIKLSWLIRGQLKNCMKNCTKCIAINWVFEFTWVDSKYRFLFSLSTVWLLPYCSIWFFFSSFIDRGGVYVEIISKDLNKWKVKVKLKTSAPDRQ